MQDLKIKQIAEGLSYSKEEKLGRGAFGQVYLGFDDHRKVPCAYKVINFEKVSEGVNPESLMKKIKDEIVNMQLARHPEIIEFYQAKQSPRNIYILCEYCNGESLASLMSRRSYLPQTEALVFFREILRGFVHLRNSNIVHRDLKPANLLLHHFNIKIGDLGFSKVTENHEQMLQSAVGTPLYMSPQIFEREKYTEKTDIWSLGVILYEMLYGRNPWSGVKNLFELKERIKKEVVFPEQPFVAASLKTTIRRMLVVEENGRISWQALFQKYLPEHAQQMLPEEDRLRQERGGSSQDTIDYFRKSLYLESQLQMPKVVVELGLVERESLAGLGRYGSSGEFYKELSFLTQNREILKQYYGEYLRRRNQVSFTVVLSQKLCQLRTCPEMEAFSCSLVLLLFRYSLCLVEEMLVADELHVFDQKYSSVSGVLPYDRLLLVLLKEDRRRLQREYQEKVLPGFRAMMDRMQSSPVCKEIKNDLSGIYCNEENEIKAIRFFMRNYLKRVANLLRDLIEDRQGRGQMEVQGEEGRQGIRLEGTVARMVGEYLSNEGLFEIGGGRNLGQWVYEWQTSLEEGSVREILLKRWQEESISSFLMKQLVQSKYLVPRVSLLSDQPS